jgi:ribosomal protein S18
MFPNPLDSEQDSSLTTMPPEYAEQRYERLEAVVFDYMDNEHNLDLFVQDLRRILEEEYTHCSKRCRDIDTLVKRLADYGVL